LKLFSDCRHGAFVKLAHLIHNCLKENSVIITATVSLSQSQGEGVELSARLLGQHSACAESALP
jgi:hypothetical protein